MFPTFFSGFLLFCDRNSRLQSWAHQVQAALSQCQAWPQQPAARPRDTMWIDPRHWIEVADSPGFVGTSTTTSTATMTSTTASWHLLERIRKLMAWNQWLSSGESWVLRDWNERRYHWYNMCVYMYVCAGLDLADAWTWTLNLPDNFLYEVLECFSVTPDKSRSALQGY